jgi:TPR repeat protein
MYLLGSCDRDDSGVKASRAGARRWFQKSADLGYSLAKAALSNL